MLHGIELVKRQIQLCQTNKRMFYLIEDITVSINTATKF